MVGEAYTLRYIPAREDLDQLGAFEGRGTRQREAIEACPPGQVLVMDARRDATLASPASNSSAWRLPRHLLGELRRDHHTPSASPTTTRPDRRGRAPQPWTWLSIAWWRNQVSARARAAVHGVELLDGRRARSPPSVTMPRRAHHEARVIGCRAGGRGRVAPRVHHQHLPGRAGLDASRCGWPRPSKAPSWSRSSRAGM